MRVSTTEQAEHGTSIADQKEMLASWAERQGVRVAGLYVDDASAKASAVAGDSFTRRPAWREMTASIEANPPASGGPDLVLVKDWSRFGRDTASALLVSGQLQAMGVEVQAVTQLVDYSNPTALFQVLIPLATAEVENRQRSINVRRGMRRAMKEGRWVAKPPVGYKRIRDANDRPGLAPNPETAPLVAAAFELATDPSLAIAEVYRRAKRGGFHIARSRFFKMLRDRVYIGEIEIAEWESEPAEVVTAIHQPIVDAHTFARVQLRFEPTSATSRRVGQRGARPEFPLRSLLMCPKCGEPVTSDLCRGNGGTYTYYVCHRHRDEPAPDRFRYRHRTDAVHEAIERELARVQISRPARQLAVAMADAHESTGRAQLRRQRKRLDAQIADAEAKRSRAEDLYVDGDLDREAFSRVTERVARDLERLEGERHQLGESDPAAEAARVRTAASVMTDLAGIWSRAGQDDDLARGGEARAALVGSIYPDGVTFSDGLIRTKSPSRLIWLLGGKRAEKGTAPAISDKGRPLGYAREKYSVGPGVTG